MKDRKTKIDERPQRPSLNFPLDSHKFFCKRCFEHNRHCPNTRSKRKDKECNL